MIHRPRSQRPASRAPRAGVPTCLGRRQSDGFEHLPDLRHVLDADPVQLDVLAIGDVRGVPTEALRDLRNRAQLFDAQHSAIGADAQHEVLVVEFFGRQAGSAAAVDAGLALGV